MGGDDCSAFFRPLLVLSLLVDSTIWGHNPVGYHLTNVLLFTFICLLLYVVSKGIFDRIGIAKADCYAFTSACLFAVFPNHSESVCWIAGRTDLLAVLLALASTAAYLKRMHAPAILLYAAGLLAKESILPLPLLWIPLTQDIHHSKTWVVALVLLPAAYPAIRIALDPHYTRTISMLVSQVGFGPGELLVNLFRFLFRVFLPPLPGSLETALRERSVLLALGPVILWSVAMIMAIRRVGMHGFKPALILIAAFLVSLLPAIRMKVSMFDTQLERLLFFPGTIACMLLSFLVHAIGGSGLRSKVIATVITSSMLFYSITAVRNWQRAGRLCDDLAREASRFQQADILVLNIPDNLNGAYVFRNGFIEAVWMLQNSAICNTSIHVLSTHSISSETDSITLGLSESLLTISLPFEEEFCSVNSQDIRVTAQGRELRMDHPTGYSQLLYYNSGSFLEIRQQP